MILCILIPASTFCVYIFNPSIFVIVFYYVVSIDSSQQTLLHLYCTLAVLTVDRNTPYLLYYAPYLPAILLECQNSYEFFTYNIFPKKSQQLDDNSRVNGIKPSLLSANNQCKCMHFVKNAKIAVVWWWCKIMNKFHTQLLCVHCIGGMNEWRVLKRLFRTSTFQA